MKNKILHIIMSLVLVAVMVFGTISASAAGVVTTMPAGMDSEVVTTTGVYDEDYNEDYDNGYNDGYNDGYSNGWNDGYNSGWVDGSQTPQRPSIFDILIAIRDELEYMIYRIKSYIMDYLRMLYPAPGFDTQYAPAENQATLKDDADTAALCEKFNILVEDFKEIDEEVIVTKTQKVDIEVTDCPGGETVKQLVNPIVEEYLVDTTDVYYYVEDDYAYNVQSIEINPEGLISAKETLNADGTTSYEFVLVEEAAYYDGYFTYNVGGLDKFDMLYHDYVADTLYIDYLNVEPIIVTGASINYPGATIKATTDAEGRLTSLDIEMPVKGSGEFALGLLKGTIGLAGYRNEGFVMEY